MNSCRATRRMRQEPEHVPSRSEFAYIASARSCRCLMRRSGRHCSSCRRSLSFSSRSTVGGRVAGMAPATTPGRHGRNLVALGGVADERLLGVVRNLIGWLIRFYWPMAGGHHLLHFHASEIGALAAVSLWPTLLLVYAFSAPSSECKVHAGRSSSPWSLRCSLAASGPFTAPCRWHRASAPGSVTRPLQRSPSEQLVGK
jgi:hypothetical protein